MKHIIKKTSPETLEIYKREEGACFNNLPKDVKDVLRQSLFDEQGGICCYCQSQIKPDYTSVIEHFLPKGLKQYSNLQLDYNNLLCSCDGGESERKGKLKREKRVYPPYCDCCKKNRVIDISPLDDDCEGYFTYDEDGNIYGVTEDAKKTIEILGLDCQTLVHRRKAAIDAYKDLSLNVDEWKQEQISVLQRDKKGLFLPFCVVIANYIRDYKIQMWSFVT